MGPVTTPREEPASVLRVGLVVPSLKGGGAEFVALQWASYLQRTGHIVTVITTHDPDARLPDITVVPIAAPSFVSRVAYLRRHVEQAGYDVLIGLMPHWNLLVLLSTLGMSDGPATIISGRNVEAPLRRVHGASYRAELALCRLVYPRAHAYVAISHPVAAEAISRYRLDPAQVWVVPNPATGKDPAPRPGAPAGRVEEGRTVTLTVPARLVRQKRPDLAVKAAAVLRADHGIDASVEFFGRGPEEVLVREVAADLDVPIRLHGWVDAWFDEAAPDAVVVLPSVAEGFGNVLVEAAAAGIASVASSQALGVADAVVPNVTGVLTMGAHPDELAAAVVAAMALGSVSAPAWLARFSPEESGQHLLGVLRSVTEPGTAPSISSAGRVGALLRTARERW
jgi:glycosyltransferase involved in cell wall biosynthesis